MRILIVACFIVLYSSCDYLQLEEKQHSPSEIIAILNTEKLFKEQIKEDIPSNLTEEDSLIFIRNYINDWAIKKLLLNKSENNISLEAINNINKLVNDYRENLLINYYKENLIKQQLDTSITSEEIETYYNENKINFKLNTALVKLKYLYIDNRTLDKKKFIRLFSSNDMEDLEMLEKEELSFKGHHFNDSTWGMLDNFLLKLPFQKEQLLKKTKLLQKQDSLGLYLVVVKDVLQRNSQAPLSHIKATIKQMILHKRKIELIRDIEKILVKDAIQNNNFKVY